MWEIARAAAWRPPGPGAHAGAGGRRPSHRPDYRQPVENAMLSIAFKADGAADPTHGMRFMGFFGRKAGSRAAAPGAADVFTAPERERVEALWRLTALPRAEFDATYGAMVGGFWRWAASARGEAWAALRRETLACAVAALRARQARVLPRFAAAEDAARLAEVMSFALAACVVAERFAAVAGPGRRPPGWRPLTDDVARERHVGGRSPTAPVRRPAPRPARGRGRARLARSGARRAARPRRLLRRRPERATRDR